ncbi:hypothetical protein [Ruegeria arenilitoris]|uniref:Secreted protein n=1 Tax=Ruegeria arenilitoris TaxID=1173585 RepID=A0A238KSB3_9RHOB|nr:hypothetical protein [Ruegeria arenilitoris]SMX45729.1 hypothetical protein RUA8715_02769 [Ruegeria arenilitoris]
MHRKFIALVVATAVAITGVSASQAKAADAHDILGGLAAIAIIGAAVNHYNKEKRKERVTRQNNYVHQPQNVRPDHIRPLPRRVARYDLPQRCLKTYNGYSKKRPLLGPNCLEKHYKHANSLPQQCKVGFWDGKKVKRAYEPACLRQKGYRVVYQ